MFSLLSYLNNSLNNLVIELCSALKKFQIYNLQLFIKVTLTFVAIKLKDFCKKNKNTILLHKRALSILAKEIIFPM